MDFKEKIAKVFITLDDNLSLEEAIQMIEIPPNSDLGDYAVPCFRFAKKLRKAPQMIAQDIVADLGELDEFEKVVNAGPYVNFFVNKKEFAKSVIKEAFTEKEMFGSTNIGEGKNVIVEFSSPNIAKPFHIGHIRTTVIGNSLYNIYKYLGYNTTGINHLGDYGTQFGMLISAYKKWGNKEEIESNPIPELLKLYVRYNKEANEDESLRDEARYWFKELENGNQEAFELWKWMREISLKEFNRVYDMFGIKFDSYAGESFYSDKMPAVVEELKNKNLLKKSQGAQIVELGDYNLTDAVIMKSDGSTLYATRDMAAAIYRKKTYNFDKNIYVVGAPQKLHFEQWKKVLELMGYEWAKDCVHVMFGTVSLEDGSLSTRNGRVVFLEDVLNKAIEKTREIIEERNPNLEDKENVAKQVGIGAVVFQELFNTRIKDYTFSWEKTLSFEGETGPYVQYAYARSCSVLRKANMGIIDNIDDIDFDVLTEKTAFNVIKRLDGFKDAVLSAHDKNEPYFITRYAVNLAQDYNRFYHECAILVDDENIKKSRILLTKIVNTTISSALKLLGIKCPQKM